MIHIPHKPHPEIKNLCRNRQRDYNNGTDKTPPQKSKMAYKFALKKHLNLLFNDKCAYCEQCGVSAHNHEENIMHFRPVAASNDRSLQYGWLSWQWPNMLYVCPRCNQIRKDKYDVQGEQAGPGIYTVDELQEEIPKLLNPCFVNPANYFEFTNENDEDKVYIVAKSDLSQLDKKCADYTIETLGLNRPFLLKERAKAWTELLSKIHDIVYSGQHQLDYKQLIYACEIDKSFAGMRRCLLQKWVDENKSGARETQWQAVQKQLNIWQNETAVLPQPYPPVEEPVTSPENKSSGESKRSQQEESSVPVRVNWRLEEDEDSDVSYFKNLLAKLCSSAKGVSVEKEFGAGFSGARVFLVQETNARGYKIAPLVAKFDSFEKLNEEIENYINHDIRSRLEKCVPLADGIEKPLKISRNSYACIAYRFAGGRNFDVESLNEYWRSCKTPSAAIKPLEVLFKDWDKVWTKGETEYDYPCISYDWLFPPNFEIDIGAGAETSGDVVKRCKSDEIYMRGLLDTSQFNNKYIELESFYVTELEPDKGVVTLNLPPRMAPEGFRVRLKNVTNMSPFQQGRILDSPVRGLVRQDRVSLLKQNVAKAFSSQLEGLNEDNVLIPGCSHYLANPLHQLPKILRKNLQGVTVSTVHGDMNLENILVRKNAGGNDIYVIDFGKTRETQNLHDLLRLEAGVWLYLVPYLFYKEKDHTEVTHKYQFDHIISLFEYVHRPGLGLKSNMPLIEYEVLKNNSPKNARYIAWIRRG